MENQMIAKEIAIQREGGRSYLLVPEEMVCSESEEWEQYTALGIRGLLGCKHCYRNGQSYWSYDVTGKQSLFDYYREREMDFEDCRSLLMSLDRILSRMYECLLSEEELWLEPEMIYIGMEEKEMRLVYGRREAGDFVAQIKHFAEYMLEHIDYKDERAVALSHQFYKYASADSFNMGEFLSENYAHLNPEEVEVVNAEQECVTQEGFSEEENYYDLWINQSSSDGDGDKTGWERTKNRQKKKVKLSVWLVLPFILIILAGAYIEHVRVQVLAAGIAYVAGIMLFCVHRRARAVLVKKEDAYYMENSGRVNPHL